MNLLFVHSHVLRKKGNNYYSTGGISSQILHRYLQEKDKIYVYTRQKSYKNEEKLVQVNDENVICIPSCVYHGPKDYFLAKGKLKREIKETLKGKDFCIIRIPDLLSEKVYKEVKKQKIPYVIEMVGCAWDALWNYGNLKGKIWAPIRYFQVKKVVKHAEYVVYVSKEFLQERYPTNGKSIDCSNVNIELVPEEILEKRLKKIDSHMKNQVYRIGLIGSLDIEYKGHETAMKAVARLKNKYHIELHFLGAGSTEKWKNLAEKYGVRDNVFFDGTLPGGEPVYQWMDDLDLFLIPSLTEGLPRALIEAMSRGCPSIGTKTGGIPELLEKEFVCNKKNDEDIAKKIEELIEQPEKMKQQAQRNFQKAKQYNKNILNQRRKEFLEMIYRENK